MSNPTTPTIEEMAKSLYQNGMSIYQYDLNKASFILEKTYPNMEISDFFNEIAFDVFFELMRIESTKNT